MPRIGIRWPDRGLEQAHFGGQKAAAALADIDPADIDPPSEIIAATFDNRVEAEDDGL